MFRCSSGLHLCINMALCPVKESGGRFKRDGMCRKGVRDDVGIFEKVYQGRKWYRDC